MNNLMTYEDFLTEKVGHHGGIKDFDKFDTKFIGTGEGAQVYGWGVYITDSESLGEFYVRNAIFNNTERNTKNKFMNFFKAKDNKVIIDNTFKNDDKGEVYGYIYTVEIPDDKDDTYIDWNLTDHDGLVKVYDKIKEHLDDKQKAFLEEELRPKKYNGHNPFKKIYGAYKHHFDEIKNFTRFYWDLVHLLGTPKDASMLLYKSGYKGIKVIMNNRKIENKLDTSQIKGYNYILFNDDDVKITNKKKITYDNKKISNDGGDLKHKSIKHITELPVK